MAAGAGAGDGALGGAVRARSTSVNTMATETATIAATTNEGGRMPAVGLSAMRTPVNAGCSATDVAVRLMFIPLMLVGWGASRPCGKAGRALGTTATGIVPLGGNSDVCATCNRIRRCRSFRTSRKASPTMRPISSCWTI
jgi:hypothetical protein